jgi:hypothetical protein
VETTFIQDNSFFETAANMQGIKIKCETVDQYQPLNTELLIQIIVGSKHDSFSDKRLPLK